MFYGKNFTTLKWQLTLVLGDQSQNINTLNLKNDIHDQLLLSIGDG